MMLLVATTVASLVGITSMIYKPVNVETQAQPQQQTPPLTTTNHPLLLAAVASHIEN